MKNYTLVVTQLTIYNKYKLKNIQKTYFLTMAWALVENKWIYYTDAFSVGFLVRVL